MAPVKRYAYEAYFKLQAIEYAAENGNRAAARHFNVNESMAKAIAEEMDIEHFQGGPSWYFHFMRRRHLSIRTRTTVAQQLPADYQEMVAIFRTYCYKKPRPATSMRPFTKVGINAEAEPVSESDSDDEEEEFGMLDIEIAQLFNSDTEDENFDGFVAEE
ncbi:hypothetical protein D4764_06G0007770 [Takifugu flavidus]|uniref:HTH CENPB-type domain-containing protein n=1 Tax=Takifugu flavidus TaxID=433684 RepID=A0A5C6N0N8_9TELE|nr:hypothetical protein D4764_06G0007770 [Takifugu flavidus]